MSKYIGPVTKAKKKTTSRTSDKAATTKRDSLAAARAPALLPVGGKAEKSKRGRIPKHLEKPIQTKNRRETMFADVFGSPRKKPLGVAESTSAFIRDDAVSRVGSVTSQTGRKKKSSAADSPSSKVFRFGSTTTVFRDLEPTPAMLRRNVLAGQRALKRATTALTKPGVDIGSTRGIPLFEADRKSPDFVIRILDGKRERGKFVKGKFVAIHD